VTLPNSDTSRLARDLASLASLPRAELLKLWRKLYGAPPLPRTSRSLMIRAVAYRMQERALGGLPRGTRRILEGLGERVSTEAAPRALRPGTLLVREWQGTVHQVIVTETGVIYRGQIYRSLSEVARVITGSRWSGPRFFGLKNHVGP